ncbi:MAG TPA: thioredoxin-like domain-containing protein [Acidobacteriota bacterium]|nr:thioredoxin-like domain-containing protein [Acidobacteriota bacterium]
MPQPRVRAPELDASKDWFNTPRPLQLSELRGKVVLLDFWTYCCINCMHVLPDLKALEERFPDELVVIGVHSAKFPNERDSRNIGEAVQRHEVRHAVVNDYDFSTWSAYAVKAWPTLVLIDPEGYIVGYASGEGNLELLDKTIARLIEMHREKGTLDEAPKAPDAKQAVSRSEAAGQATRLRYPGKVLADEAGGRLFIADSGHHRIVVSDLQGQVETVIGSGQPGAHDGSFAQASFRCPQGMALRGGRLYIADTENHLLRICDLKKQTVKRLAGTGQQNRKPGYFGGGPALETALNSPWDVLLAGQELYIAMAGPHQIWFLDLESGQIGPYAGSAQEACLDGPLPDCALAQPSGLASDGRFLYVADSEASAIRAVPLDPSQPVRTLVGLDLFQYGDADGKGQKVRLQHPLGLACRDGLLYIADTYNHKIKTLDPASRRCRRRWGSGQAGLRDGWGRRASFYEPSGLSFAGETLYIADSNNHAVRTARGRRVSTLELKWP